MLHLSPTSHGMKLWLPVLLALTLSGCGSTVAPQAHQPDSVTGLGDEAGSSAFEVGGSAGAPDAGTADESGGTPAGVGSAEDQAPGPSAADGRAGSDGSTTGRGIAPPGVSAPGAVGPGVTDTHVNIGVVHTSQANDVGEQFGARNLVYGDLLAQQQAVAEHINSTGGVAGGRKIRLVPYDKARDASPQAVCAGWTEDNEIFAGVFPGGQVPSQTMVQCMAQHRAIYINTPFIPGDKPFFDTFGPYYYTPQSLETVTMGRTYVEGLASVGFFDGSTRTGLLYYDVPSLRSALTHGVKPALAAIGETLVEEAAISYPENSSQYGDGLAAMQNAVLKFKARGIDRVMFLDAGSALCFFFLQDARAQQYRPRLGLMSGSHPSFIAENFDAETLRGTVGVGWSPAVDVDAAGVPDNAARKLCRTIMARAGQAAQAQTDQSVQYNICASFFFLREGLSRANAPTAGAFEAGLATASPLPAASAASLGEGFSPSKHWGASMYSTHAYTEQCSCFRYTGRPRAI